MDQMLHLHSWQETCICVFYTLRTKRFICFSQNKLDEALLTSGRVADAISSLLEWLGKAEASLAEDQPIMGDTDTIHMLIEQHKVSSDL